jgi:MFS transporter, OCT family, solute carrier family 22 (organic cation transporter), member 4/5
MLQLPHSQKQWKESFGTLLLYLLVSVFLWTVDSFTYYGLSLFSTQLAGNRYVNFMLVALVEVPSYVFAPFFLDRQVTSN